MVDDPSLAKGLLGERDTDISISKTGARYIKHLLTPSALNPDALSLFAFQLELIRKLRGSVLPKNFFGDNFQTQHADTNVTLPSAREPKRRFIPSKWEAKLVLRIIRSLRKNPDARLETNKEEDAPKLLWEGTDNSKAYAHALHIFLLQRSRRLAT